MNNFSDVVIVGGGPAGTSCAIALAHSGLSITLIDKAKFPRDKICGDALSVDVLNQLAKLSPELKSIFDTLPNKKASSGVRIYSPDLTCIDIPFIHQGHNKQGFVCARFDFDNLLFDQLKSFKNIEVVEDCTLEKAMVTSENVLLQTNLGTLKAKIAIGADGAHSILRKLVNDTSINRNKYSAGLRVYYEGVSGFHSEDFIELYFLHKILPGYLWIFPMAEGKANVGLGALSSIVSRKKLDLKNILKEYLSTNPILRDRFRNAKPLETIKGFGLPLGSVAQRISGERLLLTGDAAALIDPFSGEGIGNAIRSGRAAAEHVIKCFEQNNFSASFNKRYEVGLNKRLQQEFKISTALQRLSHYPALLNFVIKKASREKYWHELMINSLADINQKKILVSPRFYYNLLFK